MSSIETAFLSRKRCNYLFAAMRSARRLQRARLTCHFEGTRSVAIERQRLLVFVLRQLHPDKLTEPENGMNKKSQRRSRASTLVLFFCQLFSAQLRAYTARGGRRTSPAGASIGVAPSVPFAVASAASRDPFRRRSLVGGPRGLRRCYDNGGVRWDDERGRQCVRLGRCVGSLS